MSDLADISKVVSDMKHDLDSLGDCKKMLASPGLVQSLLDLCKEQAEYLGKAAPAPIGELYFRGSPVVECEHLEGLEYAFVK